MIVSLPFQITVIDDDSGENGDLTFKVVVTAAQEKSLFHIGNVTHTNDVYRIQLLSSDTFDHENPMPDVSYVNGKQNYKVTVLAEDSGTPKLAASCFLFVEIKDINDKVPRFDLITYNTIIMRNIARNKRVVRVFAVDDDDGTYGIVKYRIESQDENCQNCFLIDANTGWITRSGSGSLQGVSISRTGIHCHMLSFLFVCTNMSTDTCMHTHTHTHTHMHAYYTSSVCVFML